MAIYTLYACRQDDVATVFEIFELADDEGVRAAALNLLDRHSSASHVVAWCGERRVRRIERPGQPSPGAVLELRS